MSKVSYVCTCFLRTETSCSEAYQAHFLCVLRALCVMCCPAAISSTVYVQVCMFLEKKQCSELSVPDLRRIGHGTTWLHIGAIDTTDIDRTNIRTCVLRLCSFCTVRDGLCLHRSRWSCDVVFRAILHLIHLHDGYNPDRKTPEYKRSTQNVLLNIHILCAHNESDFMKFNWHFKWRSLIQCKTAGLYD